MATFSRSWNTLASANSAHTIHAVVTDFSGNQFTTSSITVTANNTPPAIPPDPEEEPPVITPPDPPIVVPTVVVTTVIPLGAVFYNTLGEFSTFVAQTVFPSASDPDIDSFVEDWINVVRDSGVLGDGSDETAKIQVALDQAATGAASGGKSKVLIPGGTTVLVTPQENDTSAGTMFGAMGVCLFLDSGVTVRIDGALKAKYLETQSFANDNITIFENRNAFLGAVTDRDESIVIEGNGTIDLEGVYDAASEGTEDTSVTKNIKNIVALRAYKVSKLTVKDITVKHGISHKLICGFSEYIDIRNVKFDTALKYQSNDSPVVTDASLITLDVCREVEVFGCKAKSCGVTTGVASWASKEVLVSNNILSDLISGDGTLAEDVLGSGFWFIDYGMEYGEKDMDFEDDIYILVDGFDARTTVVDNIFCRNGLNGVTINGAAWAGVLTMGIFIRGNKICSNGHNGIFYLGCKDYLFEDNQIEKNGWGLPLQFD